MNTKFNPVKDRRYNLGGCFSLVGTLVAQADRPDPEKPISLANAWLPLSSLPVARTEMTTYRHPGIIPALSDRSYRRVIPVVDAFAASRNWVVQPVAFSYRPKLLDQILGEDGRIGNLAVLIQDHPLDERVMVDTQFASETQTIILGMLEMCSDILDEAGLADSNLMDKKGTPRMVLNEALSNFPFLVHHIFKRLPNLHLLRHRARVNGREETVQHLRYNEDAILDVDLQRLLRPIVINVTV